METRLLVSLNFLLFLATARGFSPVVVHQQASKTHLNLQRLSSESGGGGYKQDGVSKHIMPRRKDFLALLGTIVTSSIVSSSPAMAEAEIKTFDLSLPSYDSINTLKITDEKALGVENPSPEKDTAKASKVKKTKQKRDGGDNTGNNNPLANVLPSMNKSVVKKSPQKTVEKASKPLKDEPSFEYETMDMSLPSYSTNTEAKEKDFFSIQK
ncbi:MAG: hypothetical protein ACI8RD_012654 [Bacillariaceae sp.]|jgi:hypothetical protein